jgi:hypothetical protein
MGTNKSGLLAKSRKRRLAEVCALVLSGGLFGCSIVSRQAASKLDISAYRIEQVPNKNAVPYYGTVRAEWQNFLVFSNSNIRLPLASAGAEFGVGSPQDHGFDPASLKLQWLREGELLLISWTTLFLGTGGYTHDGHVILQIRDGQSRELFRDYFESVAKGGWAAEDFLSLEITYDDNHKTFQFVRQHESVNGNDGMPDTRYPLPFTEIFTNDSGGVGYISRVKTIDTWHYQLAGGRLKFLDGAEALDLTDEPQMVEEIVKGFRIGRASLDAMNPKLRDRSEVAGIVCINQKLKPYEISGNDGLHGDK